MDKTDGSVDKDTLLSWGKREESFREESAAKKLNNLIEAQKEDKRHNYETLS